MLLILEPSTSFFALCNCIIYNNDRCYTSATYNITLHSLSMSKIK